MSDDLAKEFIRDAFMAGALDLGHDRKFLDGFLRMFAGELEAVVALVQVVDHIDDETERNRLIALAKVSPETVRQYETWHRRAVSI